MKRIRHNYSDTEYYDEFHIPKKHGKTRRICAPSVALLRYQRSCLPALEAELDLMLQTTDLEDVVHGFRKNRNIVTAAQQHIGFQTTIQLDISNCFDSISVDVDTRLLHTDGSLAQGFATSPILANIYLCNPLSDTKQFLESLGIEFALTSYADDLAISINSADYRTINLIVDIITYNIFPKHNLAINPGKTRIRYAKHGNRKILGIMVADTSLVPSRKLRGKIRAARHQRNGPSLGGLVTASRNYLPKALREPS